MVSSLPTTSSLYKRVLGEEFDSLPSVLRCFHEVSAGGKARGRLRITRGKGWLRNVLATLMRLPPQGEQVPVSLAVCVEEEAERWTRNFGPLCLVTRQWVQNGLLIEAAGPVRFGFRLTADATGMEFHFAGCWFLGVRLPSALAPRVHAEARGREACWWLSVCVEVPALGVLVRYEGEMTPEG
jgi:hypothetical protein